MPASFPDKLRAFLLREGVEHCAALSMGDLPLTNEGLLRRLGGEGANFASALLLVFPYYTGRHEGRNLSLYAVPRDYHLFARGFFDRLRDFLSRAFPGELFFGCADRSPIDERAAFARAGLGVLGDSGLLLTPDYGSFVFLGEMYTTLPPGVWGDLLAAPRDPAACPHCGRCREVCPREGLGECLSALTQARGDLSPATVAAMARYHTAWGCDLCQEVCPYNARARQTPIPFFCEALLPRLTSRDLLKMSEEEFRSRAYSWRGKSVIVRNLAALEGSPPPQA